MTRNVHNGRCTACGMLFVGMYSDEYDQQVTEHLSREHLGSDRVEVVTL